MTDQDTNKKLTFGIGIDFGTSNSAAAIFDGQTVTMVNLSRDTSIMPSANYVDQDYITTIGQSALDEYINSNRGRTVELSAELLGEERTSAGSIDGPAGDGDTSKVFGQALNDAGLPGRLFRGTKRLLGSKQNDRILIFNRPFRLVALITPILVGIRTALQIHFEKFPQYCVDHACIGHPVHFEGHQKERNTTAMDRLREAYGYSGIENQTFCPEPTAAAISYLNGFPQVENRRILTVDFGGGTLDFCILNRTDATFNVEATHGIALGGDRIDQCIFREIIFPLLGKGERWQRRVDGLLVDTLFPFGDYEDLLINWPVSYMLNQNKYTAPLIERMSDHDEGAVKFRRLYDLIKQNYSYQVFEAIRSLKAELSVAISATLDIPELDIKVELERWEFEMMISDLLLEFDQAISQILKTLDLSVNDIDLVIRTGGSSLIPAVKDILDNKFFGKVVEHDPFTSVAAGLAMADYYGYNNV
jgi:hypothetical chaperone protein